MKEKASQLVLAGFCFALGALPRRTTFTRVVRARVVNMPFQPVLSEEV